MNKRILQLNTTLSPRPPPMEPITINFNHGENKYVCKSPKEKEKCKKEIEPASLIY